MGTISEKLTYLNGTKQLLKDKINNLGGSIDEQTTFRQYVNQLDGVYDVLPKTSFQEGTEVTIEGGLKGKIDFDDGKVGFGQASQESTQGYNLLLNELQSQSINGLTIVRNADGSIKINGTATADTNLFFIQNGANNLPAGTYTIALIGKTTQLGMYFYKGTGTENRVAYIPISDTTGKTQFTINEATLMLNIYLYIPTGNTFNNVTLYPMIYSGTTDKDYEQYSGGYASPSPNWEQPIQCVTGEQSIVVSDGNNNSITYPISLGSNKFYKIGDYADELLYDVENDRVYKNEVITRKILTGANTEFWQVNAITGAYVFAYGVTNYKRTNELICICNYFKAIANGTYGSMTDGQCRFRYYNDELYNFYACMDDITNVSDFRTWLGTHNLDLYYVLATPQEIEITDQTLINQVKALYNAHSLTGTTIITSNGDLPMIIKVRALKGES